MRFLFVIGCVIVGGIVWMNFVFIPAEREREVFNYVIKYQKEHGGSVPQFEDTEIKQIKEYDRVLKTRVYQVVFLDKRAVVKRTRPIVLEVVMYDDEGMYSISKLSADY